MIGGLNNKSLVLSLQGFVVDYSDEISNFSFIQDLVKVVDFVDYMKLM